MERQLPKNVRQIGNVSDNPKIYVEDYVDTYLNQLREKAREQPVGVILTGELLKLEDENAVFVSGAVQMKEVKTNGNDIEITDEIMKEAKEEAARFFPECRIVGWGIIDDGSHTPHYLLAFVCQEIFCLAEFKCRILLGIEGIQHVIVQIGNGIGIIFIKFVIKTNELLQFFFRSDFFNRDSHCGIIFFRSL